MEKSWSLFSKNLPLCWEKGICVHQKMKQTNKAEVPLLQYNCASEPAPQNLQKETGSGLRRECPESSEVWNLNLALMLQKSSWKRLGGELF